MAGVSDIYGEGWGDGNHIPRYVRSVATSDGEHNSGIENTPWPGGLCGREIFCLAVFRVGLADW